MWNILEFICGFGDMILEKTGVKQSSNSIEEFYLKEVNPKKFLFRPQTLEQYVGQENAKALVRLNIEKILTIKPVHFLISGQAGTGKTTLANIIGNALDFKISYQIGGTFSLQALKDFLEENMTSERPMILFIDEIHNLEKSIAEFMYPIVEDFILPSSEYKLRPFILIGATTEKFTLYKKFKPLVDRCGADIVLEDYNVEDMKCILKQYNEQIYQENISEEVYDLLARNCRFTPRIAIAIFDDFIVTKDMNRVLKAHRIIKNGLTDLDIRILQHLEEINKPVGEETLAIIGGVDRSGYKLVIEPYLLRRSYISRTSRGRVLTTKGKELLHSLTNEM